LLPKPTLWALLLIKLSVIQKCVALPLSDDRTTSTAKALASAAHDLSRLGVELEEQQAAVQQKLMASQGLADSLKRQAALANMSVEQVEAYFWQVYNVASFVAADRERCVLWSQHGHFEATEQSCASAEQRAGPRVLVGVRNA
jgi:hypothetical protein